MPRYLVTSDGPISVRALARPGHGLPWPGGPTDPGWGVDEGEPPQVEPPEEPPPGIWPGPTPGHPIEPIPGGPEHPDTGFPPGSIWPRPPHAHGKFIVLAHVPGYGWRYFSVDMDALPEPPAGGVGGRPPQRPGGSPEVDPTTRR
jgi:hypothetical protein